MPPGGDQDPPASEEGGEVDDIENDNDPEGIHRQLHGSPLSSSADGLEGDSTQSAGSQARPRTAGTAVAGSSGAAVGPSVVDAEGNSSVVPDLMHVYENLKRSSTPHDSNNPSQPHQHQHQPPTVSLDEQAEVALLADGDNDSPTSATDLVGASHQSGSGSAAPPPPNWPGYTIFDFSIPTIPSAAYAVMVEGATASATSADGQLHVRPAGRGAPPPPPPSSHETKVERPPPAPSPPPPPNPPKTTSSSTASAASSSGRTLRKRPNHNHHSSSNNSRHDEQASVGSTSSGDPPPSRGGGGGDSSSGRHHSGSNKRRKSAKDTDGRWSKRFTWPEDLHRDFVSAIFDVGLKHSSPSTIMEYMPPHDKINSERIKSHLQKYRLHRAKSREEFLTSYETSLKKMNESGLEHIQALAGGEVAAHLTYTALHAPEEDPTDPNNPSSSSAAAANQGGQLRTTAPPSGSAAAASSSRRPSGGPMPSSSSTTGSTLNPPKEGTLILPRLTEDEKQSALGTSMGYLMGLFFSLTQQLMAQRAAAAEAVRAREVARAQAAAAQAAAAALHASNNPPVTAVYDAASIDASSVTSAAAGGGNATGAMSAAAAAAFAAATGGGGAGAGPSTLSNLEENSMMKREMQSQMAFQNKMRALKQEELKKWRRANVGVGEGGGNPAPSSDHPYHAQHYEYQQQYSSSYPPDQHPPYATHAPQHHHQGVDPASQQHHPHPIDHHHHHAASHSHHTYGDFAPDPSSHPEHHPPHDQQPHSHPPPGEYHSQRPYAEGNSSGGGDPNAQHPQQQQQQQQGAANPRADRQRGLSFGAVTDDLWNAELGDDEQLFEFLLNN